MQMPCMFESGDNKMTCLERKRIYSHNCENKTNTSCYLNCRKDDFKNIPEDYSSVVKEE